MARRVVRPDRRAGDDVTVNEWIARWSHILPPQAVGELVASFDPSAHVIPESSGSSESRLQSEIRLVASRDYRIALWRNNNGGMTTYDGRHVRFGLGNDSAALNRKWKSSDLIGVTPAGRFVAIEVKAPGWSLRPSDNRAQAQAAFMRSVTAFGGLAGFVQSVDDMKRLFEGIKG